MTGADVAQDCDVPPMFRFQSISPLLPSVVRKPSPVATTISNLPSPSSSPTAGLTGTPWTLLCHNNFPLIAEKVETVPVSSVCKTSKFPSPSRSQTTEADQLDGPVNWACQIIFPVPSKHVSNPLLSAA